MVVKENENKVVAPCGSGCLNASLPRVTVYRPFFSAPGGFANFKTILLIGGGISVTPFASIVKTIWYRMNNFNQSKPTGLSNAYFLWITRDLQIAE